MIGWGLFWLAVSAAARRFDAQHIPRLHFEARLAGDGNALNRCASPAAQQRVFAAHAGLAAQQAIRSAFAPIRQDGDVGRRQKFVFTHDPIAAAMLARSA